MQTIAHLTVATMVLGIAFVVAVLVVAALCIIALRLGTAFRADLRIASFHLHVSTTDRPRQGSIPITARREVKDLSKDG
jgi:hypothetical protein